MEDKKHEWYGLAPAQREKLVLELLAQGYTADMLNEYFDVKTKRVINDFMNARGYRKRDNSYIPKQQSENMTAAPIMQQQNNILPNIQIDEETIVNVLTLSKQADKIQEIIDLYDKGNLTQALTANNVKEEPQESYIEIIDTSLNIPVKPSDFVDRKTVRVSYRIYDDFTKLCKEKYPEYKQQDLVSLALQDFIDKYK
ncbi:MAG: hypothetical protein ACLRQZ_02950 [Clostridia bacterium]